RHPRSPGSGFPGCRACLPSLGMTYNQLWSELRELSNRLSGAHKSKSLLAFTSRFSEKPFLLIGVPIYGWRFPFESFRGCLRFGNARVLQRDPVTATSIQ